MRLAGNPGGGHHDAMTDPNAPPPPEAAPYVSHVEWCCGDLDRSERFFRDLFGWEFQPYGRRYRLYAPPGRTQVGLLEVETVEPAVTALAFIAVDDIEALLKRARELGSAVVVGKTAIPDYGWYAQITDPDGNRIGLFETRRRA